MPASNSPIKTDHVVLFSHQRIENFLLSSVFDGKDLNASAAHGLFSGMGDADGTNVTGPLKAACETITRSGRVKTENHQE